MHTISERLQAVRARVAAAAARSGREAAAVRLVAVAKTATAEALQEAWAADQQVFAHNRVAWLERDAAVLPEAEWHLIGPVQGNKARRAARASAWVQTVGELRTAQRLQRALEALDQAGEPVLAAPLRVLAQVNLQPEDGRYGCRAEDLAALLDAIGDLDQLHGCGLMTLGPQGAPAAALHRHFAALRGLAEGQAAAGRLPRGFELSMGMTEDFEIAIEEGATLVRVGRAVFPSA